MSHLVDQLGYPIDPEMRRLQGHLSDLAAYFRGAIGISERQEQFIREYHSTLETLYQLGWDSDLDLDALLPKRFMPEEYNRRNPNWAIPDASEWIEASKFYGKKGNNSQK